MAANVTRAQIRELARLYADERPETSDGYLTPTEAHLLIDMEIRSLYDRLIQARGHDYYESESTFSTVSGTATYQFASMTPAASDFYEMRRVQIEWGTRQIEDVGDFKKPEENRLNNYAVWGRETPKGFRVIENGIKFAPTPTSAVTVRIVYIPAFTTLASDGATFDGVNGWHDAVALGVAMKIRKMQNLDASDLRESRDEVLTRIDQLAADRAADQPAHVIDVQPESNYHGRRFGAHWLPRA